MKRSIVILVGVAIGIVGATSIELPICTAPGDQLYPDVCWDGEAFWVVWQDEKLGTIRGVRVSEDGELLTDEVELLESGSALGPVHTPSIAAGLGRFAVEARVMVGYNEFFPELELWGVIHREFAVDGEPLTSGSVWIPGSTDLAQELELGVGASAPQVLFGRNHFFSLYKASYFNGTDGHAWSLFVGFDDYGMTLQDVWSSGGSFEFQPSIGCWDGEQFLIITSWRDSAVFLEDSLLIQGIGWDFQLGREIYKPIGGSAKYQVLISDGRHFFMASEIWQMGVGAIKYKIGFDILDSTGMPIKDSATIVDLGDDIKLYYPDAVFNGEHFQCVWENRSEEAIDLYSIKVDTLGEIVDSGYLVYGSDTAWHPAAARGAHECLIVWSDNRDGDFNVYGTFQDAVGVEEQNPLLTVPPTIIAQPSVFTTSTTLYLPDLNIDKDLTLKIYDNTGSLVRRLILPRGEKSVVWDGCDATGARCPRGVYFIRMHSAEFTANERVVLIK